MSVIRIYDARDRVNNNFREVEEREGILLKM